jgi:hypothetical protein
MKFRYTGPMEVREVWGVAFPTGAVVHVADEALQKKVAALEGFERAEEAPADEPAFEPVETDWQALHWKQKVKMARELTGIACANGSEADVVLKMHFEASSNA